MTITLDDVSNLLHMPIVGQFYTLHILDADSVNDLLVESLRVDRGVASEETRHCRGAHVCLSWLRDVYEDACSRRQWNVAARAYLLTSVSVIYLGFLVDLRLTEGYAWATTALTHMYEQLEDCSYAKTRQLAGYATLLQGWMYEHFLFIGMRRTQNQYSEDQPRYRMYEPGKVVSIVVFRLQLDTLTLGCIQFSQYDEHREFESISLFSGYLMLEFWTQLHMRERVLC